MISMTPFMANMAYKEGVRVTREGVSEWSTGIIEIDMSLVDVASGAV
jgi:hypothetical protein